jgi:hypothetical protein
MRWAFAASLSRADRFGQVSAAGSRLTQQEAVAAGPRPARHRHRSALMRGDGIPWLAAHRSGCPRSGARVLTSARTSAGNWKAAQIALLCVGVEGVDHTPTVAHIGGSARVLPGHLGHGHAVHRRRAVSAANSSPRY